MISRIFEISCVCASLTALVACDQTIAPMDGAVTVSVDVEMPEGVDEADVSDARFTLRDLSGGQESVFTSGGSVTVMPGLYDISYKAGVRAANGVITELRASLSSVSITADGQRITLRPYNNLPGDDFVISEIFFAGTLQPSGNKYCGDDYVKIYNNTDHVLYADGLTLFESKFTTTDKYDYSPDIMGEAMTVHALYTIPGSGTEHPVPPGGYILLADTGIDHRDLNPLSFDLSGADWEWYDISTKPSSMDIASPVVPDLDKWYCYTLSFWLLHDRGFKAYGIARIPVGKDEYLRDYLYSYDYTIIVAAGTFPMTQSAYRLPNDWIVDVVNCSVEAKYAWNVSSPRLDMGWTSCGTIDHDKTRYFHAVRRKLLYLTEDGRPVLKDTNNSTDDFNAWVTPSEIERQGTAVDVAGHRASAVTYDGVIPVER